MISRRKFIVGLVGAGLSGSALKLMASDTPFPDTCDLRLVKIPAPAGWSGKTALFLTDIHYSNFFGPRESAALNRLVRKHAPDLVLMGGDLAQRPTTGMAGFFSAWSPGCPTLFAPGNHDTTDTLNSPVVKQARESGFVVLCNTTETWNGITFVGFPSALKMPQRESLLRTSGLKILLAHEPDTWDRTTHSELVQLAGHTHGGQIRLWSRPIFLPPLGKKYPLGEYSQGPGRRLIVSAGIGCTTIRARINCPPEMVKLVFV